MSVEEMVDAPSRPARTHEHLRIRRRTRHAVVRAGGRDLLRKPFVVMPIATMSGDRVALVVLRPVGRWQRRTRRCRNRWSTVSRGTMSETVSADGTVAAAQTDDLSFTASGTVTEVNVKAGDTVSAGQVLAKIDSAELDSRGRVGELEPGRRGGEARRRPGLGRVRRADRADETSVTSAKDSLANAKEDLAGASLVASFDGTVASVDLTVGEVLGSGGTGGSDLTGSDSGSGQSSSNLGSGNTQDRRSGERGRTARTARTRTPRLRRPRSRW